MTSKGGEEPKARATRIWTGLGAIILAANTEFIQPYTLASYLVGGIGLAVLLRALFFDFSLRLKQFNSSVSRILRRFSGPERVPAEERSSLSGDRAARLVERTIGVIAFLLPFLLIYGGRIAGFRTLASLSAYYYSPMRNILVGALCALGALLVVCAENTAFDRWLSTGAGLGFIGYALFPVMSPQVPSVTALASPGETRAVAELHIFFFTMTFLALGTRALRLGLRDQNGRSFQVAQCVCAALIFFFLLMSYLTAFLPTEFIDNVTIILSAETAALTAVGASWFVRSRSPFSVGGHDLLTAGGSTPDKRARQSRTRSGSKDARP